MIEWMTCWDNYGNQGSIYRYSVSWKMISKRQRWRSPRCPCIHVGMRGHWKHWALLWQTAIFITLPSSQMVGRKASFVNLILITSYWKHYRTRFLLESIYKVKTFCYQDSFIYHDKIRMIKKTLSLGWYWIVWNKASNGVISLAEQGSTTLYSRPSFYFAVLHSRYFWHFG